MKTITCVTVDDREIDRLLIDEYINSIAAFKLLGSFESALEAAEFIQMTKVDVLFLDIDMPVVNGIDFLHKLKNPPICVFITAHSEYAVEAFGLEALDYLVKPVKRE